MRVTCIRLGKRWQKLVKFFFFFFSAYNGRKDIRREQRTAQDTVFKESVTLGLHHFSPPLVPHVSMKLPEALRPQIIEPASAWPAVNARSDAFRALIKSECPEAESAASPWRMIGFGSSAATSLGPTSL